MSFSMQKLRALLPGKHSNSNATGQRHSVTLEPEIGFQISIELSQQNGSISNGAAHQHDLTTTVPELNVQLIAARHLPSLFGFKVVQGYLIKVKLFPGSKRMDSTIQTNSWPKFNENFRFPLAPDIKPSLKQCSYGLRNSTSKVLPDSIAPENLFAGQFVVFTVYALLELPPASFNRLNKTYRSLREKSTNLVQKMVETSNGLKPKNDDKENTSNANVNMNSNGSAHANSNSSSTANGVSGKKKPNDKPNPHDAIPPLTVSEARRNIGSVTCYLEPKIFKRNSRTGQYSTDELWLPIRDLTMPKTITNTLNNSAKGLVEIILELRDVGSNNNSNGFVMPSPLPTMKHAQWNRMTSEVRRKMGLSNVSRANKDLVLRVTTSRMRCSPKVKDELEANAGSIYVKTTAFEHDIYVDAWKSENFYPSLATKWDTGTEDVSTLTLPLRQLNDLDNLLIRTTLATKTKMGKKLVLGEVVLSSTLPGSTGCEQLQQLRDVGVGESVAAWHAYQ